MLLIQLIHLIIKKNEINIELYAHFCVLLIKSSNKKGSAPLTPPPPPPHTHTHIQNTFL